MEPTLVSLSPCLRFPTMVADQVKTREKKSVMQRVVTGKFSGFVDPRGICKFVQHTHADKEEEE